MHARLTLDRVTAVVVGGLATLLIVPWDLDPPEGTFDTSWIVTLHESFVAGRSFGEDVVFTFGPWGFVLGLVLFASIWRGESIAFAVVALYAVVALAPEAEPVRRRAAVPLLGVVVWFGLAKFTLGVAGLGLVVLVTVARLVSRRPVGPDLAVFIGAWLALWLVAGQSLAAIPHYIVNSASVASGYSSSMGFVGPTSGGSIVGLFALVGTAVLVGVLVNPRSRSAHVPFAAGLLWVLFVAFKAGMVRGDEYHVPMWVRIDASPTLVGRVKDIVFRVAPPQLEVVRTNGRVTRRRIVPGTARGGFILSPAVGTATQLGALIGAGPCVTRP